MPVIVARVLTSFILRVAKLIIEHWRTYPQKRQGRYCLHAVIQMLDYQHKNVAKTFSVKLQNHYFRNRSAKIW